MRTFHLKTFGIPYGLFRLLCGLSCLPYGLSRLSCGLPCQPYGLSRLPRGLSSRGIVAELGLGVLELLPIEFVAVLRLVAGLLRLEGRVDAGAEFPV